METGRPETKSEVPMDKAMTMKVKGKKAWIWKRIPGGKNNNTGSGFWKRWA